MVMRFSLALVCLVVVAGCSGQVKSEAESGATLPEVTDSPATSPEAATLGTDPFLATDPAPPATPSSSDPLIANDPVLPSPTPPRGESSTVAKDSSVFSPFTNDKNQSAAELPPLPEPPSPLSSPDTSPLSEASAEAPKASEASAPLPPVQPRPSLRKQYREFRTQRATREEEEEELADRSLFLHEDGAQQLQMDFLPSAYGNLDFDPSTAERKFTTKGGKLAFLYYPLRGINTGRLGLGLEGGGFWAKFDFTTGSGSSAVTDSSTKLAFYTYGLKAVYEAQFFVGQILVPFGMVGYERVNVRPFQLATASVNYPKRKFYSTNYGAGVLLNLNRLERDAASRALGNTGIKKFYLAYTYLRRNDDFNTGDGHSLGLRFEF